MQMQFFLKKINYLFRNAEARFLWSNVHTVGQNFNKLRKYKSKYENSDPRSTIIENADRMLFSGEETLAQYAKSVSKMSNRMENLQLANTAIL